MLFVFWALLSTVAQAAPIRVGYSTVISTAGYFIALERGYFKEYGLEIEGTPFRGSAAEMTALLASGKLDVGAGNITAGLWNADGDSAQIKLVADKGTVSIGHDYIALLVRADLVKSGRFHTLKDLKGMKMAFTALGGVSQEIVAERFLRKGGLTAKDATYVKMSYADMNAAFRTKQLDATVQVEPYLTMAEQEGIAVKEGSVFEVYPGQPSAAILYSAKFASDHPDDATKFMAAYLRGVRDYVAAFGPAKKNKAAIITILSKHTEPLSEEVWAHMAAVGLNPDGYLDTAALGRDLAWYREHRYVDKAVKIGQVVDQRFVEGALRILAKGSK